MFKKKEITITTIIGRGAVCEGNFTAEGSVRVDGTVNGDVTVTGTLIVGAAGSVQGDITAAAALIGGEVNGNVTAPERAELTASARVIGDISTGTIIIDEKAVFQGRCDMNQEVPGKRVKPNGRVLRAGKKSAKAAIEEALKEVKGEREKAVEEQAPVTEEAQTSTAGEQ